MLTGKWPDSMSIPLTFEAKCEGRPGSASLALDFRSSDTVGRTVLASSFQEPPLKVVRAFALPDGAALAHIHNVSGGLLGGDNLSLAVDVGAGARVQLTTTGATRVYRPRPEAATTTQTNKISVAENGLLEYVPDAIIPYAGARFSQRTRIRLGDGAGLFWWEILSPGREARGEIFQYELIEMRTNILAGAQCIAAENVRLEPLRGNLLSLARLGPFRYWATFYLCRLDLAPKTWREAEQKLREITERLDEPGDTLWGVSTLVAHGLVVRCLARQGRRAVAGLHTIWNAAKQILYNCEAIPPRKVN